MASPLERLEADLPSPVRTFEADQRRGVWVSILGLFVFYVAHDGLQERAFRTPGFEFGWFMTAVEIGTMAACAALWEHPGCDGAKPRDAPTAKQSGSGYVAALVLAIAVSQGTGSAALQYVNYPVKVAVKSCKLVPTLAFSTCLNGARYSYAECIAALIMCLSLALLGLADSRHGEAKSEAQTVGFLLLGLAVCSDAVIPNLQEKLLRQLKMPVAKMVVYSNLGSFTLVVALITFTGELGNAVDYCRSVPDVAALLLLQALCAYCGLRCYLSVIRSLSGVAGVLTTSARKVVTLILSFALFEKPFSRHHALALLLLAFGISLAVAAKSSQMRMCGKQGAV
ncbi:UAA transporter [Pelagophyceae sp. CCMP2097]|nr:UAA transporter [Pelagophyceae sp. CCMP2097]